MRNDRVARVPTDALAFAQVLAAADNANDLVVLLNNNEIDILNSNPQLQSHLKPQSQSQSQSQTLAVSPFPPDHRCYSVLMALYARRADVKKTLAALIRAYGINGKLKDAMDLFASLFERSTAATASRFPSNSIDKAEYACALLDNFDDSPLDEHLFDAIIEACQASRNIPAAEHYWEMLLDHCRSWDQLFGGNPSTQFVSARDSVDAFQDLNSPASNQQHSINSSDSDKHLPANTMRLPDSPSRAHPLSSTYARMIDLYAHSNIPAHASIAAELLEYNIIVTPPTAKAFEDVIRMHIRRENLTAAQRLYMRMVAKGYRPSMDIAVTINQSIRGYN
eukprot:jgi/Hompol1/124/HPOL_005236-RA